MKRYRILDSADVPECAQTLRYAAGGYGGIGRRARFRFFRHTSDKTNAELMELADMQDLGSCAERRVGSSPTFRIIYKGFL